ncbi:Coatomer subunit beta' [Astathelohania contejeani]|uniref:Coatomer subunit beta n=1 Tax=Astathelohania contejeani TaxID=164912 RepID=A0ABQ7HVI5_9MICR|nr:Coatomer subunit beta' [Thelohania contejeani]
MKTKEIIKKLPSPRVKSITLHPTKPLAIICLYTGVMQLLDTTTYEIINSISIPGVPIRTGQFHNNHILIGTDEGEIRVYEQTQLTLIQNIKAHSDFVRKIDTSSTTFLSCSDDTTIKLWELVEGVPGKLYKIVHTFSGHIHFVMDVKFYPGDPTRFVSCSLDQTIKIWSLSNKTCLATLEGHSHGVNCINFINEFIISGSDDPNIKIWNFNSSQCIHTITGHTKNVNDIECTNTGMVITGSEDGTIRVYNNKFESLEVLHVQMERIWSIKFGIGGLGNGDMGDVLYVGCDEGLSVYRTGESTSIVKMSRNRIYYTENGHLMGIKVMGDNTPLGVAKSIGVIGDISSLEVCPTGKTIGFVNISGEVCIYSSLGFRCKYKDKGDEIIITGKDSFIVRKGNILEIYKNYELEEELQIEGMRKIWNLGQKIGIELENKQILVRDSKDGEEFMIESGEKVISLDNKVLVYNKRKIIGMEKEIEIKVDSWFVGEGRLYILSGDRIYYLLDNGELFHCYTLDQITNHTFLIGVLKNQLFYFRNKKIEYISLDLPFMEYQRRVLRGGNIIPDEDVDKGKAICFLQSLNRYEDSLTLCQDVNQKFDILLRMKKYDTAFELVDKNSMDAKIKYKRLGKEYMKNGEYSKAADCFYGAHEWANLFLVDGIGGGKYLQEIAKNTEKVGLRNLAFLAYHKLGDYKKCGELIVGTDYEPLFRRKYDC